MCLSPAFQVSTIAELVFSTTPIVNFAHLVSQLDKTLTRFSAVPCRLRWEAEHWVSFEMPGTRIGLADNWLRHVQDVRLRHRQRLNHLPQQQLEDAMCEMNVIEQVGNVALSNVMQDAWGRGQKVAVHGWVYGLNDGIVKDMDVTMTGSHEVVDVFRRAFKRYPRGE